MKGTGPLRTEPQTWIDFWTKEETSQARAGSPGTQLFQTKLSFHFKYVCRLLCDLSVIQIYGIGPSEVHVLPLGLDQVTFLPKGAVLGL